MQKTVLIVLLGCSTLALLVLCIIQHRQLQTLSAERAALQPTKPPVTVVSNGNSQVAMKVVKTENKHNGPVVVPEPAGVQPAIEPHVATTSGAAAMVKPVVETPEESPASAGNASAQEAESPMAGIAKMMKNPGMKDMIRAQSKMQLDITYGSLFRYLQLNDADLEALKVLLLDRQMSLVDTSMDMMGGSKTQEEMKALRDQIKETTADHDSRIKKFLGEENYGVFQKYEATQPERMQVSLFKGSLSSNEQLAEEQEDGLIRAMHDERTNFNYSVADLNDRQVVDPSQFTQSNVARMLADGVKLQEQYEARAAAILTPSQLEKFKAHQKQQQAMHEMALNMASKMFGKPSHDVPPAVSK